MSAPASRQLTLIRLTALPLLLIGIYYLLRPSYDDIQLFTDDPLAPGERIVGNSPSGSTLLIMARDLNHLRLYSALTQKSTPLPDLDQYPNHWILDPSDANLVIIGRDTDHGTTEVHLFDANKNDLRKLSTFPASNGLSLSLNGAALAVPVRSPRITQLPLCVLGRQCRYVVVCWIIRQIFNSISRS